MRPFFERHSGFRDSQVVLRPSARAAAAGLYVLPSFAILGVLLLAAVRKGRQLVLEWLATHVITVLGGLFLITYGLVAFLRPDLVIKWIGYAFPDYDLGERDLSVQRFVKGLGFLIAAFGLFVFKNP